MREDVLLDVDADPAQRDSLGLADGHREGDADRELPALELKGAHVVRREHRGDGDFLGPSRAALLGPRSTLANMVEFLRSLVTTILVPLLTLSVMFRRAMMGAPILRLRMCAGRHPSLMLVRYSWGYWWPFGRSIPWSC